MLLTVVFDYVWLFARISQSTLHSSCFNCGARVIAHEIADSGTKVPLVDRDNEVQALAPNGSDDAFAKSVRGRRPDRSLVTTNTEILKPGIDSGGEDRVEVVDHESIPMVT